MQIQQSRWAFLFVFFLSVFLLANLSAQDLFFSEYLEGTSNNKALEIFNGTGADVDLSSYKLYRANNGSAVWQDSLELSGMLSNGDVYVVGNASAVQVILDESDTTHSLTFYNGDDAIGLAKNGVMIDMIGVLGVDPGSAWDVAGVANATNEQTLIRKPTVTTGNTDWASSAGTNADDSEWIVYPQDTFNFLGYHSIFWAEHFTGGTNDVTWEPHPIETVDGALVEDSTAGTIASYIGHLADTDGGFGYATSGTPLTDHSVSMKLYVEEVFDGVKFYQGLVVRADTTSVPYPSPVTGMYYRFVIREVGSEIRLQRRTDVWKTIKYFYAGVDYEALTPGWHELKLTVIGNQFWPFIDGNLLPGSPWIDDDNGLPTGFAGALQYGGSATTGMRFDDFMVFDPNYPPELEVSSLLFGLTNTEITLQASSSDNDGDAVTYNWSQTSGPSITLSDPSVANPTFTPTVAGIYEFEVYGNDGTDNSMVHNVSVVINDNDILPLWHAALSGGHRGTAIDPHTGWTYVTNTDNTVGDEINVFYPGNETGIPDDSIQVAEWGGFLGPYGVDVADDGFIYVAIWVAAPYDGIYQVTPYGEYNQIVAGTGALRGLAARGSGASTEVYYLSNTGDLYKVTTTDGINFTSSLLVSIGGSENASIGLGANAVYTVGYYGTIHAWDYTTGASIPFPANATLDGNTVALSASDIDSILYVGYRETVITKAETLDVEKIGKVSVNTGAILSSSIVGDTLLNPYNTVFAFDVVDGKEIAWSASNGIVGAAVDVTSTVGNRAPGARAMASPSLVSAGNPITFDGSASGDIDGDAITYSWTQVSGPTLDPADPSAATTTVTPQAAGDYVYQLVVNDGQADSDPVQVSFSAESRDFFLAFDTPADSADIADNWDGDLNDDGSSDGFTTASWAPTEGIEGGALKLQDGGFTAAYERPFSATENAYFSISAYISIQTSTGGTSTELWLQVAGLNTDPVRVDIKDITSWTKVTIEGYSQGTQGKLQITGSMPFQSGVFNYVWLDSVKYDDDATLPTTYTLSGNVGLSDTPPDLSDSWVRLVGFESVFGDSTDASGNYSIAGIPGGTYDVLATKFGYKDEQADAYEIMGDSTLNFTLNANQAPVADAGADITGATAGQFLRLDGTGSNDPDGDPLTYHWVSLEGLAFQDANSDTPGVRPTEVNTYTFALWVEDGTASSDTDTVIVDVTVPGAAPYGFEFVDKFGGTYGYHGITVDPEGKIWAAGFYGSNYLRCYYPDGTEAPFSPITQGLVGGTAYSTETSCRGITSDHNGNILYATSAVGAQIMRFDYRDGTPIDGVTYGTSMTKPSVDQFGNIYVTDVVIDLGDVVTIYDSTWTPVGSFDLGIADLSRSLEINPAGDTLYLGLLNTANGNVRIYTKDAGVWGFASLLEGPFAGNISAVDLDVLGRLWVSDETGDTYYVYSADLSHRDGLVHEFTSPRGAATDAAGKVAYLCDFNGQFIERWSAGGNIFTSLAAVSANDENGKPALMDSVVTVHGYVTVGDEFNSPSYIQSNPDGGYGVAVFDPATSDTLKIGDEVILTGAIGFYNGLTEIINISSFQILSQNNVLTPFSITALALADTVGEDVEGLFVTIDSCTMDPVTFGSSSENHVVHTPYGDITMRTDSDAGFTGYSSPAGMFTLVGVGSQFDGSTPHWSGYQVFPRNIEDIGLVSGIDDGKPEIPTVFALHQNYPNPFNPVTTVKYDLPKSIHVKIEIYNMLGQKIRTLVDAKQEAGYKSMEWDGKNDLGSRVATGQYIYRIDAGDFVKSRKMVLLK